MVTTSTTRHSHAQLTPKILHETKTIRICTTAWIIQLRRHTASPAWYTSDYPWKANCERHVGIPWSKGIVSQYLNEPLLIPSCLCHQKRGELDLDYVEFFPHNTPLPYNSSSENVITTAHELAYALKNPSPQAPFSNIGNSQIVAI